MVCSGFPSVSSLLKAMRRTVGAIHESPQRANVTSLTRFLVSTLLSVVLAPVALHSQDTTAVRFRSVPDTLGVAKTDTTAPAGLDTVVIYSARDSIVYSLSTRTMTLHGESDLKYRKQELKAAQVAINWDTATLRAEGAADSSRRAPGEPVFNDAGEVYSGRVITYNFRTQKGRVVYGKTQIDQGYYGGEEIKKIGKDVLYVAGGKFTTCDSLDNPDYYFYSPKIKITTGDKVVAEPIYLYIADVPVFALPFGVFPSKGGRRSGFIAPAYGEDFRGGRFLNHFGYYFALSDYMDLATTVDWYTKGGWVLHGNYRYRLRYFFDGSLSASFTNRHFGESIDPSYSKQREYNINIQHHQEFSPTLRADANFTFLTGSYYQATSTNLNDLLRQNVVSNATIYKSWEGTNNSLGINIYRDQNLQSGELNQQLPSVTFSHTQSFPFRPSPNGRGAELSPTESQAWYELIGIGYTGRFLNQITKTLLTTIDTSGSKRYRTDSRYGAQHLVSINFTPKLGHFNVTPFLSYTELWYPGRVEKRFDPASGTVVEDKVNRFSMVRYFNGGLSASTKFYGIMQVEKFGISGFRHTVTPSLSFTYQPDFSKPFWGYYETYRDTSGNTIQYSRYDETAFGGAPRGTQQALSFSITNLFEMKTLPADSAAEGKKFQLIYLTLGSAYNFAADSMKLSPVSLSYRTSIGNLLSIFGMTTLNPYVFDDAAGRRVNRFLWAERRVPFEMTNFTLSLSTSFKGEGKSSPSAGAAPSEQLKDALQGVKEEGIEPEKPRSGTFGLFDRGEPDIRIPWSVSLGYDFSLSRDNPNQVFRSSNFRANLEFKLTENWRFSAGGSYDFIQRRVAAPNIHITRDLHCWEMLFDWVPSGPYSYYRLEIRLKAPQLQDIKVTKQGSARGVY